MNEAARAEHLETADTLARLGGDEELLADLYAAYAEDLPKKLRDLADAAESQDFALLMKRAHSLKGSSAAVGAVRCRALAIALEESARAEDLRQVRSRLKDIAKEIKLLQTMLQELF